MGKAKKLTWTRIFIFALFFTLTSGVAQADLNEVLLQFQPSISVQEEYTNNVNLTQTNKKDDFITTVNLGVNFSSWLKSIEKGQLVKPTAPPADQDHGIDLSGQMGFVYYANGGASNYFSLAGNLNAWYTWANRLTLRLGEYILRSDEQREQVYPGALPPQYGSGASGNLPVQYLPGTQRLRSIYFRNVFSPSAEYKFSRDGAVGLAYTNNVYTNQSSSSQNSVENYISPYLTYWFDIRNGITLNYGYTTGNFQSSPDMTGQMAHGQYTYRFNPRTSIFADYVFTAVNYHPESITSIDYNINSPSLGINHQFSPSLSLTAQGGYFWESPQRGKGYNGPTLNVILTQQGEKTTYSLVLRGGYQVNLFTAENLGATEYYTAAGTVTHRLMERMTTGLSGSIEWDKWKNTGVGALTTPNQINHIWGFNGNVSYDLLRWLTLSLNLAYTENDSNISSSSYNEFHATMTVAATYK